MGDVHDWAAKQAKAHLDGTVLPPTIDLLGPDPDEIPDSYDTWADRCTFMSDTM